MTECRFLIMAGGTGGHVFPALATARMLKEKGHHVEWLGSRGGMEERLLADTDIPLHLIQVSGLRGKGGLAILLAPFRLLRALAQAFAVVRSVRPDCVIGMGGFAAGPGGLAAYITRKPLVIHEQNAIAGMTNRILSRFAHTVLEAFPGAFDDGVVTRCTGNPVRSDLTALAAPQERMAGRKGPLRLLVVGGSLGARAINERLPQALALIPEQSRPKVRHQCGGKNLEATREAYRQAGCDADIEPFISDMAAAYGDADLVLCRAGALTVSELCVAGLGAILVPFPHAVDDHQAHNAGRMVSEGGAIMVRQPELTPEALADILTDLSRSRARDMAVAARRLARPDATERVVNYCLEAAHG
jgi:UDP-N-acetylglucosamine--N-acetylmuramyl-(pentapeptide) pyrophosphoryl-undecaprenol N-acetylglucosamine transferase